MAKAKTDVLLINAEALFGFPKGIQAYVRGFAERIPLEGVEYFVMSWASEYQETKNTFVTGVGPKFPENATHFREGLNAGVTPYSWLLEALSENPKKGVTRILHEWVTDKTSEQSD